jgi:hypothetical protein
MRYEEFRPGYIRILAQIDQEIAQFEDLADQPSLDDNERGMLNYRLILAQQSREQIEKMLAEKQP